MLNLPESDFKMSKMSSPYRLPLYLCNSMIRLLGKNSLKSIFGCLLLGIFILKFFTFSISSFSSSSTYSIEKSAEESKDKEEESFDTAKKKLLLYESSIMDHEHPLWTNHLPVRVNAYRDRIGNFPPKNVPTPPPDGPALT